MTELLERIGDVLAWQPGDPIHEYGRGNYIRELLELVEGGRCHGPSDGDCVSFGVRGSGDAMHWTPSSEPDPDDPRWSDFVHGRQLASDAAGHAVEWVIIDEAHELIDMPATDLRPLLVGLVSAARAASDWERSFERFVQAMRTPRPPDAWDDFLTATAPESPSESVWALPAVHWPETALQVPTERVVDALPLSRPSGVTR